MNIIFLAEKEIFRELLYFLPSVVSITIDLDIFRKLHLEQEIMNILIENLETLKIGDIGFFAASDPGRLTLAGAERISRILKNFCRSKVLKAIKFECGLCYDEWEWDRENVSAILKGLVANGKDEIASSQEASDYAVSSFEDDIEVVDGMTPYYMDTELEKRARDKIHKVDESWTDFQEILSEIKQSVKYSQTSYAKDKGKEALATGNIESVSLCINCFLHVGNFLPNWKTVRRLSFEGCLIRNAPSDGMYISYSINHVDSARAHIISPNEAVN